MGPKKHILDAALTIHAKGQLLRKKKMLGHARRHTAASCTKMAEPIDLRFGLWSRMGRRQHKFNRMRQVAPMCPHGWAHWRHLVNTRLNYPSAAVMRPYAKLL